MPHTRNTTSVGKTRKWSQQVTETSDALDLKPDVFTLKDPKAIARSLKASAEHSDRRKAEPYRSAMSMLTFYINRAGHQLAAAQRKTLERAKDELRVLFDRAPRGHTVKKGDSRHPAAKKAGKEKTPARGPAVRTTGSRPSAHRARSMRTA